MKKLIIALSLMASFTTFAEEVEPVTDESQLSANCELLETLSREIMTNRQFGIPLRSMLEIMEQGTLGRKITLLAYSMPVYGTEKYQQKAINDFANGYLLECVKLGG